MCPWFGASLATPAAQLEEASRWFGVPWWPELVKLQSPTW